MPTTPTARPACAKPMPIALRDRKPASRARATRPPRVARIIQAPRPRPSEACHLKALKAKGSRPATNNAANAGQRKARTTSAMRVSRQRKRGATPSSSSTGTIKGTKTALKYGGPTETLPRSNASSTSGYRVPSKTVASATSSSTLPVRMAVSRDTGWKSPGVAPPSPAAFTTLARRANSASEPPMTIARKIRMNRPRSGSWANACTEDSTPERTRNVPTRDSENAPSERNTVQTFKAPRRSVTTSECTSAVPASHGIRDAFSDGSQNHHPPQPSS